MQAEQAYLFRHALLRDAAYQLQLPADRAGLHALAIDIVEAICGGRPPFPEFKPGSEPALGAHPTNVLAGELAVHARLAQHPALSAERKAELRQIERLYLRRAAEHADLEFSLRQAQHFWIALADLETAALRGEALRRAASDCFRGGQPRAAQEPLAQALSLATQMGDPALECAVRDNIAFVHHMMGCVEDAEREYQQTLALAQSLRDPRRQAMALGNLANVYLEIGRVAQAEDLYGQALAIAKQTGDRRMIATSLGNLALLYGDTGRTRLAEETHLAALAIHREIGNRRSESIVLANLAALYDDGGRFEEAEPLQLQSLALQRAIGDRRYAGAVLGNMGSHYLMAGDLEKGKAALFEALAIARETANRRAEGTVLGNLGTMALDHGDAAQSRELVERAISIAREVGNRRFLGLHYCDLARCLLALNEIDAAKQAWTDGRKLLEEVQDTTAIANKAKALREACEAACVPAFHGV